MAPYYYLKKTPKPGKKFWYVPLVMIIAGFGLLANIVFPVFLYELGNDHYGQQMLSPIAGTVLAINTDSSGDMTKPGEWFPSAPKAPSWRSHVTHYTLSIPKLGINNAMVEINGSNLEKSLIHYPGTTLPGSFGTTVIFGHSVLPQFFNPKNYKTIFATLPTIKEGDEILIAYDGVSYRYRVIKMFEVLPDNISVLEQHYDDEYLNLITCVPPGTYLRRLVVVSRLVDY